MANLYNLDNKFLVTTGGNVLIGQTSAVGSSILQVTGTMTADTVDGTVITDGFITMGFAQLNRYGAAIELQYTPTNAATLVKIGANGSNPTIFNAFTGDATFAGNVGIGAAASDGNLHVRKTGVNTGITNVLMNANFADGSNGTGLSIGYRTDETTAVIAARTATGNIAFYSYDGGWSESMRIKNNGNVGIGTDSPTQSKLVVIDSADTSKQIVFSDNATYYGSISHNAGTGLNEYRTEATGGHAFYKGTETTPKLTIDSSGNSTFAGNQVTVDPASGDAILQLQSSTQTLRIDQNSIRTGTNNNLALFTNGNSNQLVLKQSNGYVGIGTASPGSKLEIVTAVGADAIRMNYGQSADIFLGFNSVNPRILLQDNANIVTHNFQSNGDNYIVGSNVGIGVTSPDAKLQVNGSISSGTGTAPTQIIYDSNGNVRAFTHNFTEEKSTPSARNVTFVDVSGVGNFHQAFFYVQYGTRLQSVSDATTGVVIRTYGVNRFNGGTLQVTETNAIAGSSNSLTHALVSVAIVSNTQYRVILEFSSTLGASSFVSGEIKGYGVGDTFPTITFAEGAAG